MIYGVNLNILGELAFLVVLSFNASPACRDNKHNSICHKNYNSLFFSENMHLENSWSHSLLHVVFLHNVWSNDGPDELCSFRKICTQKWTTANISISNFGNYQIQSYSSDTTAYYPENPVHLVNTSYLHISAF